MTYQTNTALAADANTQTETNTNTALPFQFGLRRRALSHIEQRRRADEIDVAVGSNATD